MNPISVKDIVTFGMFMLMGAGGNWVAISAIAQETSIYIATSPQGLCVGSFLTISNNAGFLGVLFYFAIFRRVMPIPHVVSIPIIFLLGTTSVFLAAFAYQRVVNDISLYLYIANFFAGVVGAVGSVILPQFLAYYQPHLITAGRAGGNAAILISACLAIAQSPGGADRFSARTYLLIFACFLLFPLFPFYSIIKYRIGERDTPLLQPTGNDHSSNNSLSKKELEEDFNRDRLNSSFSNNSQNGSNLKSAILEVETNTNNLESQACEQSVALLMDHVQPSLPMRNSTLVLMSNQRLRVRPSEIDARKLPWTEFVAEKLILLCFPSISTEDLHWMRITLPYALAVGFADFCAFGIMSSAAPFSFNKTSAFGGELNLSISIQAGSCVLMLGDLLTAYCYIPLYLIVPTMFCCTMMFVLTAFGVIYIPPYALIVFSAMVSFMEAHTLTSTYRIIASKFPYSSNQKAARLVGFLDGFLNTLGAVIGLSVVISVASC